MTLNQPNPLRKKESAPRVDSPDHSGLEGMAPLVLWGLGVLTASGTLAIVIPYVLSGVAAVVASLVVTVSLFGSAAMTWRQLMKRRGESNEETLLREAFHSVLTPQLITDAHGNLLLANRAFRGWIDLGSQNAEQALTARFSSTPAAASEFKQIKAALHKGQPGIAELPVIRGGKLIEWRRIVSRPIEGFAHFYHWRFEDISERRRMEKAMRDEQNKLLDFMAHAPVGIYSVDQNGRFLLVNKIIAQG